MVEAPHRVCWCLLVGFLGVNSYLKQIKKSLKGKLPTIIKLSCAAGLGVKWGKIFNNYPTKSRGISPDTKLRALRPSWLTSDDIPQD